MCRLGGGRRLRYLDTPHIPHGWDAGVMLEESSGTLLCGDLFTQIGDAPALTASDPVGPAIATEDLFRYSSLSPGMGATIRGLARLAPQRLALMNGPTVNNKITDPNGRISQLVARLGDRSEKGILSELYLSTLARFPTEKELNQASAYIEKVGNAKEAYEDLMWAMLNSKEFLFNH